ncbi:response regulator transcription factor [Akkermansiaceae bacterium]|nr:response regulator transcription factor [bacterium]MDA8976520.1 response regulator transcription factor [bacterium]MDA9829704.1 response regulator transcription factor [Akkermansiaceae bacterium]MDB4382842.1 response regulator transcription factor [Akkermansiaceae bacterium]MDF1710690.1 response regulator transcription factor [Akkermansiaceae bacterium]
MSALSDDIAVSIIEDDLSLRAIYADWIERAEGFKLVSLYDDGQNAFEGIPADKPDVVLSDINLPGMNGVECVRGLKQQLPKVQFVMITVYEDSNRIFKALEAGATGYLLKQTPREQLLESLREVFEGGSPMSSGIARKVVQCFRKSPPITEENELSQLSKREEEVLGLLSQGYLCKEISEQLGISNHTVDTYRRRIYEKLHVHSRAQATARYNELKPASLKAPKD